MLLTAIWWHFDPSMTLVTLLAHRLLQEPCILIRSERLLAFSHSVCRARFAGMSVVVQAWAMTRPWWWSWAKCCAFQPCFQKNEAALPAMKREFFWWKGIDQIFRGLADTKSCSSKLQRFSPLKTLDSITYL